MWKQERKGKFLEKRVLEAQSKKCPADPPIVARFDKLSSWESSPPGSAFSHLDTGAGKMLICGRIFCPGWYPLLKILEGRDRLIFPTLLIQCLHLANEPSSC